MPERHAGWRAGASVGEGDGSLCCFSINGSSRRRALPDPAGDSLIGSARILRLDGRTRLGQRYALSRAVAALRRLLCSWAALDLDRGGRAGNQAQQAIAGRNGERRNENGAEDPMEPLQGH